MNGSCTNCGVRFVPERRAFCPECGQETLIQPPKVMEFVQQFGGAYFSTEGALWRTLKLLLLKPGELTVQYLAGRRKHYVLPLRLYLSISLLLLIVVRLVGDFTVVQGLDRPDLAASEQGALPRLVLQAGPVRVGVRDGQFVCESLPQVLCAVVRERAAPDARTLLRKTRIANERVTANLGAVMFVLLPLFALCLRLVYRSRGMRYTAHLVFALHLHSFWFLVLMLMQTGWPPLAWLGPAIMAVYTLLADRRVYGGGWGPRLVRASVLTLLYVALQAVAVPLLWLLAFLA